jgi:hypothetical protein
LDAVKLNAPDALLARAVGLFFRIDPDSLEHRSILFELHVVAQRYPGAAREDKKTVVIL